MAKKKNNNEGGKNEEGKKNAGGGGDGGKKGAEGNELITVVLKTEIDCEGCATKLTKWARSFPGVESAKADMAGKLTVVGSVDPAQVRKCLAQKTKKKVDLVSPQPKKDDKKDNNKDDKKQPNDGKNDGKKPDSDSKKPKEAPVTTAVIKMRLHCNGCIEKIQQIVSKTKGVQDVSIDEQKETVTVKGTMDVKALTEKLKERFKRDVEIVPPKKEKEEGDKGGGGGGGGNGGGKKKSGGEGGGGGTEGVIVYGYMGQPVHGPGYVAQPVYGPGYVGQPVYGGGYVGHPVHGYGQDGGYGYGYRPVPAFPAHLQFSDENPNACSVM